MKSLFAYLVIYSAPILVAAAGLVPCEPKMVGDVMVDQCGFCQVGQLIQRVADWFGVVLGIVLVIVIIVGGLTMAMSVGNVSAKAWAKKSIATAIVGYIIFLGAWYLVDTFMKFFIPGSSYGLGNPLICT